MSPNSNDLIAALVDDLKPVAPLSQGAGMAQAVLALILGAAIVALGLGVRPDLLSGRLDPVFLVATGLFLVLALAAAWAALDMARPFVGVHRDGWAWTGLMAAVLPAAALGVIAADLLAGRPAPIDGDCHCLVVGLLTGLLTALVLGLRLRRGAPTSPGRAGLFAGVAAGAAGVVAVSLNCPHSSLVHIGVWHGGTVILGGLAGRLLGPRLFGW